jgi:hypothetical protein
MSRAAPGDGGIRLSPWQQLVSLILVALGSLGGWYLVPTAPDRLPVSITESTPHLSFTATLLPPRSDQPSRMSIVVEVRPHEGMHVFAPGGEQQPVTLRIDRHPFVTAGALVYPEPSPYFLEPLQQRLLVYRTPFRLTLDLAIADGARDRRGASGQITGEFAYQACDDGICYLPVSVPVEWPGGVG